LTNYRIIEKLKQTDLTEYRNLADLFEMARVVDDLELNREVLEMSARMAREQGSVDFYNLYKRSLLFAAPHRLDEYLLYLEIKREPEKKFYVPRRKVLKPIVDELQRLEDGELDFLSVSLPPRVGKSTLCIMFLTWVMGRHPHLANLMSGHSDRLTNGFYRETLSILEDPQYSWSDVFPGIVIANTSAKDQSIDLDTRKRFPTLTCRSIEGTLTGAVEVGRCLYCDDLIEDLEEALNIERLDKKYDAYANQLKDRMKEGAYQLMVGTRWSVWDVQGRIERQYEGNPRYKFLVIPALDENGESNFKYPYNLGFSTAYYMDMKESIDDATWSAKYMGEPYEREGLLFPPDELNYYNGSLPDGEPDRIIAVCDVAWGGGDSLSMPFAYVYGDTCYIHDVIFNRGDKETTRPIVVGKMKQHLPHITRFEANNGGDEYADRVDELLKADGIRLNIGYRKAPSTSSKMSRIIQVAPEIKRFYFRSYKDCDSDYKAFMRELTGFVITGKNKHDDAPDSLAMLAVLLNYGGGEVEVFKRPF
jgi:predicted phage terminase large subunit-like protein